MTGSIVSKYLPKRTMYISKKILQKYGKDEKYYTKERILLRETGNALMATYLSEKVYSNRSLYSILITNDNVECKYVLALLNSKLLQFYYEVMFKAETDLFPKIRIAQAKLLPISFAAKEQQQQIIDLVDKILAAKKVDPQVDTSDLEHRIDELVYPLYNLNPDEIAVIEGVDNVLR